MTEAVTFPPAMQRFASLEEFYEADERRRHSGEADYGIFWWDGEQGYSDTWRISVVAVTGEVYAMRAQAFRGDRVERSQVVLLGKVAGDHDRPATMPADSERPHPTYVVSDRILEGWNLVCGESRSLQWVLDRVLEAVGEAPAPISILVRHQSIGAHVHMDVFVGRQQGSRGRAGELILREEEWDVFRAGLEAGFGARLELVERVAPAAEAS